MKRKKYFATLLLAIMGVSVIGCGTDKAGTASGTNSAKESGSQTAAGTDSAKESAGQATSEANTQNTGEKELITIKVGCSKNPDLKYLPGEDLNNNAWTRAYAEKLGYKLDYALVAPSERYDQKVALAMTSGDLPDVWDSSKLNFYMALEGDYIADLTDKFDVTLTDLSKKFVGEYELPFQAVTVNGRLMGMPQLSEDPTNSAQLPFIRHDWLEKLNIKTPETQQEMIEAFIAFAKNDPDGNGKDDTYGLGLTKGLWGTYGLEGFFNSYHAYPNIWYEGEDGKLIYGTVQAEVMKAGLTDLARLYKEGAIDKEFVVKDYDKVMEDATALKVGAMYGGWSTMAGAPARSFMADEEKVPDRWWCIDPVSVDDKPIVLQSTNQTPNSCMVANKKYEKPEVVFEFVNMWFELMFPDNLTVEDYRKYAVDDEVTPSQYAYRIGWWPYINPRIPTIRAINEGKIDPSTLTGECAGIWKNIKDFEDGNYTKIAYDHYWNHSQKPHSSMDIRYKLMNREGSTLNNMFYGLYTETMSEKMSTLDKMRDETIMQIITGEKPVDSFDEFVKNWYELGGEQILKEMNDWYSKQK